MPTQPVQKKNLSVFNIRTSYLIEVAVSSSYLVLAGTWYNRRTTSLRHASNDSSYHTHAICRAWGGARGGATLYGCHNNGAYVPGIL